MLTSQTVIAWAGRSGRYPPFGAAGGLGGPRCVDHPELVVRCLKVLARRERVCWTRPGDRGRDNPDSRAMLSRPSLPAERTHRAGYDERAGLLAGRRTG